MMMSIFIEPHERHEALDAYKDRLTLAQIEEIDEAPESAIIRLTVGVGQPDTTVTIIEED